MATYLLTHLFTYLLFRIDVVDAPKPY